MFFHKVYYTCCINACCLNTLIFWVWGAILCFHWWSVISKEREGSSSLHSTKTSKLINCFISTVSPWYDLGLVLCFCTVLGKHNWLHFKDRYILSIHGQASNIFNFFELKLFKILVGLFQCVSRFSYASSFCK